MQHTPAQLADLAAGQIVNAARLNGRVITSDLIDAVMTRDQNKPWGAAHIRTVRTAVRRDADQRGVPLALTPDEEYRMHRAWMRHLTGDALDALLDDIHAHSDPRGDDPTFLNALSATRHPRTQRPARLRIPAPLAAWGAAYATRYPTN